MDGSGEDARPPRLLLWWRSLCLQICSRLHEWDLRHLCHLRAFRIVNKNAGVFEQQAGGAIELDAGFLVRGQR